MREVLSESVDTHINILRYSGRGNWILLCKKVENDFYVPTFHSDHSQEYTTFGEFGYGLVDSFEQDYAGSANSCERPLAA